MILLSYRTRHKESRNHGKKFEVIELHTSKYQCFRITKGDDMTQYPRYDTISTQITSIEQDNIKESRNQEKKVLGN